MIAELVTTVALLAESPERRGGVGELLVEHEPRLVDLAPRRAIGDQLGEALLVDRAEPDQALDVGREPGLERLEPPLGPELEERVGLEPRLLGLLVLLGADGRLEPVERQRDQVVVGLVVRLLPLLRHRRREVVLDPLRQRVDVLGRAHALGLLGRLADDPAELGDPVLDRLRARRVALGELGLQVGERGDGAGVERGRLLDLEVERDPRVLDAAAVLDRDEREEAQQLLGAAGGLLRGQRRGGEVGEPGGDPLAGGPVGGDVAGRAGGGEGGEVLAERVGGVLAAVLDVARREDRPVGGGLRRRLGEPGLAGRAPRPRRRRRAGRAGGPGRRRAGPSGPPRAAASGARSASPAGRAGRRSRRCPGGSAASRCGTRAASSQARAVSTSPAADGGERDRHRAAEQRALERAARGRERLRVAAGDRARDAAAARARAAASASGAAARICARSVAAVGPDRPPRLGLRLGAVVEDQLGLRGGQAAADRVRPLPRCVALRRGGRRGDEGERRRREQARGDGGRAEAVHDRLGLQLDVELAGGLRDLARRSPRRATAPRCRASRPRRR